MVKLPENFIKTIYELLGNEAESLIKALDLPPVISLRFNKRKPGAEFSDVSPVPWCKSGVYLKKRPEFIFDPLLHAGAYYVQDASSMIYETLITYLLGHFSKVSGSLQPALNVLDLCAAPGGKTTAMINALPDGSFITANEYSQKRVGALKENLAKWGYPNVIVTNKDSSFYAGQTESFDIVAVDAPCSGEGMMRKEEAARTQWTPQLVEQCATLQREILLNAVKTVKPGGFLIYSTCTFNHKENEENAEFIADELGMIPFDPQFPSEWGIHKGIETSLPVYRFMPHITDGEGLFLAVFRKAGEWEPTAISQKSIINPVPNFPTVDVDRSTALAYLRGESINLSPDSPKGMVTITYKGLRLGEAKNIGSRANNHYPKPWRILKR